MTELASARSRLFWKFFAAFWFSLLVASLVVGGFVWLDAESTRRETPRIDQGPFGRPLVDAAAATARHGGRAALEQWLTDTRPDEGRRGPRVYAVDARGRDLLGRDVPVAVTAGSGGRASAGEPSPTHLAMREIELDGEPWLLFVPAPPSRPALAPHGRPDAIGLLGFRLPPWFWPLAIGIVASVLLAGLLAAYFAKPIRALDGALKRAGGGDLDVRVAPLLGRRRDEIANLGHEFDRMIRQIGELLHAQRRLLHDVSHEMRSPLARMQACVALARRDPMQAATLLERIERETVQMDGLVEEILTLARLESGAAADASREPTDVVELLAESVRDARIEAETRRVRVSFEPGPTMLVSALPTLLRRAFDNVIRNALQFAPEGSEVEVTLARRDACLDISVCDRGPGLAADECARVFEPFVRGRSPLGAGHGLGLAIARRAIEAHAGTIVAAARAGGGLQVTMRLPTST